MKHTPATPLRRVPDVIQQLANDRARLVEELRSLARKYEHLYTEHCEKSGYTPQFMPVPVCEARTLLRELGEDA
jgi:hypothetical protein